MSKLERLLNLTAALLDTPRPLTVDEIHERIPGYPDKEDSFRRAFERDKDDLREMGVPIDVLPLDGTNPPQHGYRIEPERYYLTDPGLAPDELAALRLAARSFRLDADPDESGLDPFRKLGGLLTENDPALDEQPELAALPTNADLPALLHAALERRIVEFDYQGQRRRVHPYRVDFQRGRWYLTAHDETRGEERHFRVERIAGDISVDEAAGGFERPDHTPGLDVDPLRLGAGETVTARLRIDPGHVAAAQPEFGDHAVWTTEPDGGAIVELEVSNRVAFRSLVLGFLDHAELLGPDDLRTDLVEWLEAAVR